MAGSELAVGLIGLDTSHATAFTRLLNHTEDADHVAGARVVAGYPGGSADFPLSINRVHDFTRKLRDEFGLDILDRPEAVAERVDLLFITAVDGRIHREMLQRIAPYRKPTFVDKPFATTVADAQAMLDLAHQHGFPLMSCSSVRYADPLVAALADDALGPITGIDVFGPMAVEPPLPGLFWYGIHALEGIVTAMGVGCRRVHVMRNEAFDLISLEWQDGRMASFRGTRKGHKKYGCTLHREQGLTMVADLNAGRPLYASMLEAILSNLPRGRSDVPDEQMLEIIRIAEAANISRETGRCTSLEPMAIR